MATWLERFVLALLAVIAGAIIVTNTWRLDRVQQVSGVIAVAAIALFVGRTIERTRDSEKPFPATSTNPTAAQGALPAANQVQTSTAKSDDTTGSAWIADTPLDSSRTWHAAAADRMFLYVLGGFDRPTGPGSDTRYRTTQWTSVEADGTLAPWRNGSPMSKIRIGASAVVYGNSIYAIGGETGDIGQACDKPETCFTASIERAEIRTDGSLGPWELIGKMQSERWGFAAIVIDNRIYIIGGNDGKKSTSSVELLTLDDRGNISNSKMLQSLAVSRWAVTALHLGDYLYAFGGTDDSNTLRSIERAKIQPNGTIDSWELVGTLLERRHGARAVVHRGTVYVSGGYSGAGPGTTANNEYLSSVEIAAFDGTVLGPFKLGPAMRSRRGYHALVDGGRALYAIGGGNGERFVPTIERLSVK